MARSHRPASSLAPLVLAGALLLGLQKELLLASFDPTEARAIGLPVRALEQGLLLLVGLVVVHHQHQPYMKQYVKVKWHKTCNNHNPDV